MRQLERGRKRSSPATAGLAVIRSAPRPERVDTRSRRRRVARAPALALVAPSADEGMSDAVELQRGLLPRVPLERGALRVSGDVLGSRRASGDHFDVLDGPGGRTSIFVVDIAGHGVAAALIGAAAREALRVALGQGASLEEAASALESCLEAHGDVCRATAAFAMVRFSADASLVEVMNAGLPPVTLVHDGHTIAEVPSGSMPAGFARGAEHPCQVLRVAAGALVVVASDGATRGALDAVGMAALVATLMAELPDPAGASAEAVREAMRVHLGYGAPADDATVVIASRSERP